MCLAVDYWFVFVTHNGMNHLKKATAEVSMRFGIYIIVTLFPSKISWCIPWAMLSCVLLYYVHATILHLIVICCMVILYWESTCVLQEARLDPQPLSAADDNDKLGSSLLPIPHHLRDTHYMSFQTKCSLKSAAKVGNYTRLAALYVAPHFR